MEDFNHDDFLSKMLQEFNRTDEFYMRFKSEFSVFIMNVLSQYYSHKPVSKELQSDVLLFADELISAAETTLYKDLHYTEDRLKEEVKAMDKGASNVSLPGLNQEFLSDIFEGSKKHIVKFFPDIFELSSNGFRLLNLYIRLYHTEFATTFTQNYLTEKQE